MFQVAGGSVAGTAHVRAGVNDQDAFFWAASGDALVAFVCDGCGSGKASEVGARLGARLLARAALERIAAGAEPPSHRLWEEVRRDVLARIATLGQAIAEPGPGGTARAIAEHFLFTLVGVAISPAGVATVSLGDGVIALNGEVRRLGPFEGNEPPYLAYGLLGRDLPIRVHDAVFPEEVRSVLVGTDGVFDLLEKGNDARLGLVSSFWTEDRYFRNADAVRRRLALANRETVAVEDGRIVRTPGLLPDDTTLVVLRRRP